MNHPLEIEVAEGSNLSAIAGGQLNINFLGNNPNGHDVAFSVWCYAEAGDGEVKIEVLESSAIVQIPETAEREDEFHVIVEGTDVCFPSLIRFQRVVIEVKS